MRALLLRLELQGSCSKRWGHSALGLVRSWAAGVPASQTLIVLSFEPETILVPSWLKATERTKPLCALCFSALSSRDPVGGGEVLSFGLGEGSGGLGHLHPRL